MQRSVYALISVMIVLITSLCGNAVTRRTGAEGAPISFGEVLAAHTGGPNPRLAEMTRFRARGVRITPTQGSDWIEREILVAANGVEFRRETSHPSGSRREIEVYNATSGYHAIAVTRADGLGHTTAPLETDERRFRATSFNVQTCSLAWLLREFTQAVEAKWLERTNNMDRFRVVTMSREWIVSADDEEHVIRTVETGNGVVIQYSDYRQSGGVRLPYVQRVSHNSRLAYEVFFKEIELNPPNFEPNYFDLDGHTIAQAVR